MELKQTPNIVPYKEPTIPNINSLDLAVGIPSYNEADNIEFVVRQLASGLERYFPHFNTVIINADNFSQDGTEETFIAANSGRISKVYLSTPAGVNSFASTRVRYLAGSGQVHYRTAKGVARSMDALDWIAQVVSHIPDPGEQWLRYDGWYSNAARGKRRKRGVSVPVKGEVGDVPQPSSDAEHFARQRRRSWARLLKRFTKSTHFVVPTVVAKCTSSPGSSNRR